MDSIQNSLETNSGALPPNKNNQQGVENKPPCREKRTHMLSEIHVIRINEWSSSSNKTYKEKREKDFLSKCAAELSSKRGVDTADEALNPSMVSVITRPLRFAMYCNEWIASSSRPEATRNLGDSWSSNIA